MFQSSLLYIAECVKGLEYVKADADNLTVCAYSFDLKTKGTTVVCSICSIMRARMWPHVHLFVRTYTCVPLILAIFAQRNMLNVSRTNESLDGLAWPGWPGLAWMIINLLCPHHARSTCAGMI